MKYTWRVFRYSRLCTNTNSLIDECGYDLNQLSQTVIHSQIDANSIKEEKWIHVYAEENKSIEITLSDMLEIKLFVSSIGIFNSFVLERVTLGQHMSWMVRSRSFACRVDGRKFQVTFYNKDELETFHKIFSERICTELCDVNKAAIRRKFIDGMAELNKGVEKLKVVEDYEFKVKKCFKELKKDFLNLVNQK